MKDTKNKEQNMIGPQVALQRYLDDLLQDATTESVSEDVAESAELESAASEGPESELSDEDLLSLDASFKDFEQAISNHETDLPKDDIAPSIIEPEPEPEPEPVSKISKTDPLPWATGRFECLLFYVGGLKMAVPLVELGGIFQSGSDKLTSIFGQPDWFMGVANVGDFNLRTVDTALWVMPNHYEGDLKERFKFVIQLDRSDWGVACERVAEAITLEPSQVKWRSDRSKRPWLAGTVIDHMCAILDVQGFIELLDDPKNGFKGALK
ncbi:MAG: chemotaxis protein CheW [Marinomonas foliarum]|uniref:chemotaxis protein CheW n=1 Tax=Marinomonas foliarum TaxID=491950 RepID=UPI003F9A7D96